jgi:diacylglycerol kinase family enzyme
MVSPLEEAQMHRTHLFIINPKSFWNSYKRDEVLDRIHGFFRANNDSNYAIHISRFPRDAVCFIPSFAKEIPEGNSLRVYAVGGDGILFDCLNGIMGLKNVELAVIPYGRTNNFMMGFGKNDMRMFRRISLQYNAPVVSLDVMRCGNKYALNHCLVGPETEAVRIAKKIREKMEKSNFLARWLRRRLHMLFYVISSIFVSTDKKLMYQHYEVDVDGEDISGVYQGLHFYNAPYVSGGLYAVNNSMPNDGVLNMLVINCRGILPIFGLYPFSTWSYHKWFSKHFTHREVQKIIIQSKEILRVVLDSIVFYESELEVELLPGAVQFIDVTGHGYTGLGHD